jgi:NADH dehydrogenase
MNVLVVGGTGFIGTELCRELDDRDHDVTALSRSPGDADLPASVNRVAGDVTDYDTVADAFEGRDAVYYLVALSPLFQPSDKGHEAVHLGGAENTVRAARDGGVDRLVHVSALGADPDGPTAYVRTKGQAERRVRDSGLDWTIFRPSVVFGDGGEFVPFSRRLTTPYVTGLPGGGRTQFQPVWVGDLVPMLADALDDDHVGETYEVGGPEVLTLADVTRMAYRACGQSVSILPVPMALAAVGLKIADPVSFVPFGADQARSLRTDNTVGNNDVTAFGVDPDDLHTLRDYLGLE